MRYDSIIEQKEFEKTKADLRKIEIHINDFNSQFQVSLKGLEQN